MKGTPAQKFWRKVSRSNNDACWLWMGNRNEQGYGIAYFKGKQRLAHRAAWMLGTSRRIPKGMYICHKCDNPPCVNPAHLFLGTPTENVHDCIRKGRFVAASGERNGMAKLTDVQAIAIRQLYVPGKVKQIDLARQFNISQTIVSEVIRGVAFKHLL